MFAQKTKVLASVFVLLFTFLSIGCTDAVSDGIEHNGAQPVKIFAVKDHLAAKHDEFLAEIDASARAELSFQVAGEISDFSVRMGEHVVAGQVLVTLDPSDLRLALDAAKARFALATTQLERAKSLYGKKLISEDEYDQTKTLFKSQKASYEQAKTELAYTEIKAPFDGIVASTFAKTHQVIAPKQPIINLISNQQLDVVVSLPGPYVEKRGMTALTKQSMWVTMDVDPSKKLPATFKEISTQPDLDTNSYSATLTIKRPAFRNLLTGMTGLVNIANPMEELPLSIPESAWVSRSANEGVLWVINEATSRVNKVTVSLNEAGQVVAGLTDKDLVVIAGVSQLTEGQDVKAWQREDGI